VFLMLATVSGAAQQSPPKIRPYAGIGVLHVSIDDTSRSAPLYLYDEPGLSRRAVLDHSSIPPYEWIFGTGSMTLPLIVAARKGTWLKVVYDDAGREAWINPPRSIRFRPWNTFFKMHVSRMLPGLQKRYYQLYQTPGQTVMATLAVTQIFKVLRLENDWAQVVADQDTLGWVRWRDDDGKLLIGIATQLQDLQP
jgi:hypothetical protein